MKVLLISANKLKTPYPVYPLGLDYVANAIAADHEVRLADMNDMEDNHSLAEVIDDFLPDMIGISLRNVDNSDTTDPKEFIAEYRELVGAIRDHSDALLVLGGSGFTLFPREIIEALEADYGIIGEGEKLPLLLRAIEDQERISGIPGVITRGADGVVPGPWEHDFTRSFHKDSSYLRFYLKNGGMLNLQTKRGCGFQCIYCTYPHIEGNKLRLVPPRDVADAALRIQEAGARYFFVTDSAFNGDYYHSMEVARAFIKSGVSIPWGAFFAPTNPPEDYYRIMADAGLTHVEFGTESLSDDILASYRKPFRVDHVFGAHKAARDAGLHVAHYFLLGGPGENYESLDRTLSDADRLEEAVLFFFCGMRIYPYTALYDIAVEAGQISESQSLLEPVFYESEAISNEEIILRVKDYAKGRTNWVIGSGGEVVAKIVARMYARGHYGPLWEHLIRW